MRWYAERKIDAVKMIIDGQRPSTDLYDNIFHISDERIGHPEDCKIETVQDEMGTEQEVVVLDQAAKDARLAAEAQAAESQSYLNKLNQIRNVRQPLLLEADVNINILFDTDNDISLPSWKNYRQELRDITDNYKNEDGSPNESALDEIDDILTDISWPVKPE